MFLLWQRKEFFFCFHIQSKMSFKNHVSCFHCLFLFSAYKIGFERFPVTLVKTQWVKQPQEEGLMATKTLCEITVLAASVNSSSSHTPSGAHGDAGPACSASDCLAHCSWRKTVSYAGGWHAWHLETRWMGQGELNTAVLASKVFCLFQNNTWLF